MEKKTMTIVFNTEDQKFINELFIKLNNFLKIIWWYKFELDSENMKLIINDTLTINEFWVVIEKINNEIKHTKISYKKIIE